MILSIFIGVYLPSIYIFWWHVYSNPLPIFIRLFIFLLLSCDRPLSILETDPISDTCFKNIFTNALALSFHLLKCLFEEQKFLMLIKFNFSIFLLWLMLFVSSKIFANLKLPKSLSPVFPFRGFIILHFTFMSMINFKLIFVGGKMYVLWTELCAAPIHRLKPQSSLWLYKAEKEAIRWNEVRRVGPWPRELVSLWEETPENSFTLCMHSGKDHVSTQWEGDHPTNQENRPRNETYLPGTLIWTFSLQTVRNKFLCLRHSVVVLCYWQPKQTKTLNVKVFPFFG